MKNAFLLLIYDGTTAFLYNFSVLAGFNNFQMMPKLKHSIFGHPALSQWENQSGNSLACSDNLRRRPEKKTGINPRQVDG